MGRACYCWNGDFEVLLVNAAHPDHLEPHDRTIGAAWLTPVWGRRVDRRGDNRECPGTS
ncbi:MAG TPA: hypothetical protein VM242_02365 [Acidimicrobiales bacterium]|jgi:hypothetical protein|nr:hypothetical protein [Acidimicrobiales bacterium]